jgi:hypothetical protein
MRCLSALALVLAALAACKEDAAGTVDPRPAAPHPLAGVYPEQWQCDSVATLEAIGQVLGGPVTTVDAAATVPRGVPRPCNYELAGREPEFWTFDIDCRDGMKQRADALFEQYQTSSREQVQRYEAALAAHPAKSDAGVGSAARPALAVEVSVGAKGLDHHGQGLIFIDDDAPCYVRVVGKDAARRLELARLVAKNLTFANAPMTPRPLP